MGSPSRPSTLSAADRKSAAEVVPTGSCQSQEPRARAAQASVRTPEEAEVGAGGLELSANAHWDARYNGVTAPRLGLGTSRCFSRSGCVPLVVAIEAAGFRDFHDSPALEPLHRSRLRAVHGERAVATPAVVMLKVVAEDPPQVPFV